MGKTAVHIVGRRSYLAGVLAEHLAKDFVVNRLSANQIDGALIRESDVVINCAFPPALRTERVASDLGVDGVIAEHARRRGARFVMLSSRAVYSSRIEPPLSEDEAPAPLSTYGANKSTIEVGLRKRMARSLLVLRLGNIFGSEPSGRPTFVSQAIGSLRSTGTIDLHMLPSTRKDFVPHHVFGRAVGALLSRKMTGTFNIGSGIPLCVGEVAAALIRGNGTGNVRVTSSEVGEEFCLDNAKLYAATGIAITKEIVVQGLEAVGRETCK